MVGVDVLLRKCGWGRCTIEKAWLGSIPMQVGVMQIYTIEKVVGVETNADNKIRNNIYRKKWLGLIPTQGGAGEDADL